MAHISLMIQHTARIFTRSRRRRYIAGRPPARGIFATITFLRRWSNARYCWRRGKALLSLRSAIARRHAGAADAARATPDASRERDEFTMIRAARRAPRGRFTPAATPRLLNTLAY